MVADTWGQGVADAQAVVDDIAANYDIAGDLTLQLEGELARGATVTAHVTVDMPAPAIPLVGSLATSSRTLSHTEPVDLYRSLPA